VPVTVCRSPDELVIWEVLIESNRQRAKDNIEMGRESDALMGIEAERAKWRQAAQAKVNLKQGTKRPNKKLVTASEKGQSRDTVGKKVG
jgi:hypothetical protein